MVNSWKYYTKMNDSFAKAARMLVFLMFGTAFMFGGQSRSKIYQNFLE